MTRYEVTVTYTVDVVDEVALRAAGLRAWGAGGDDGWSVAFDEDGAREVEATDVPAIDPTPEASLSWIVGQLAPPSVPGAQFGSTAVGAKPLD